MEKLSKTLQEIVSKARQGIPLTRVEAYALAQALVKAVES